MKRLIVILSLLVATLTFAPSVSAVTACTQKIQVNELDGGTGYSVTLCAEDYPLVRTPPTNASFDMPGWTFGNGHAVDNNINSYNWDDASLPGTRIRLYRQYYFNGTGDYIELVRPSGSTPWVNLPGAFTNTISSFAGCGSSCSDDPT